MNVKKRNENKADGGNKPAPLLMFPLLALLCGILTACTAADINDDGQFAAPSALPAAPAPPDGLNAAFINEDELYYHDHDFKGEEQYITTLADLPALSGGGPVIAARETPTDFGSFMRFDEADFSNKNSVWGYDMRSCDVSGLDLSVIEDYNDVTFDSNTVFPSDPARLPAGFDPARILEFNRNPGLGIRALHEQGITGEGVGVAIIDQALLTGHEQYRDNLMLYERIHCGDGTAQMHGPAVAAIAAGKDTGVAPGAKLYYIAETHGHYSGGEFTYDKSIVADCILRVLDINRQLPEEEKIRVISISLGFNISDGGFNEVAQAVKTAESENIFVLTTSTELFYKDFYIFGADRDYDADPDDFNAYIPASWLNLTAAALNNPEQFSHNNIFPMGSRTYASCTGESAYEICHDGGLSWAVPWCAGFYALCCQVKPEITPQEFIRLLNETSIPVETKINQTAITFGRIVNPEGIIDALRGE